MKSAMDNTLRLSPHAMGECLSVDSSNEDTVLRSVNARPEPVDCMEPAPYRVMESNPAVSASGWKSLMNMLLKLRSCSTWLYR